jgi:ribose/xylose/arabinose/galactoside ABC-type transport system permease subunit
MSGGGGIDLSAGAIMFTAAVITVEAMNCDPLTLVPSAPDISERCNQPRSTFGAMLLAVLSQFLTAFNTSVLLRYIIMGAMLIALLVVCNRKPAIRH